MACPSCSATVEVPKLGELRNLPSDQDAATQPADVSRERHGSLGFSVFAALGGICLVIAGFCGVRWGLLEKPRTTEEHLVELREAYQGLSAAQLIREYEGMEKGDLDALAPLGYKRDSMYRDGWGRNASIAGGLGVLFFLTAFGISAVGRKQSA